LTRNKQHVFTYLQRRLNVCSLKPLTM